MIDDSSVSDTNWWKNDGGEHSKTEEGTTTLRTLGLVVVVVFVSLIVLFCIFKRFCSKNKPLRNKIVKKFNIFKDKKQIFIELDEDMDTMDAIDHSVDNIDEEKKNKFEKENYNDPMINDEEIMDDRLETSP